MRKDFKKWLFITNHLKSENTSGVKKILLGVPNEAVLLRITKDYLNIKRSLHLQTLSNCKLFFDTPCIISKERCHAVRTPAAHRKLEILHLYFFKFVNPRWRLRLVRRTGESERIQAEKENMNVLTAHN